MLLRSIAAAALAVCALPAAPPPSKVAPIKFTDTKLSNGLRVIVVEDHYAPVFAISVTYNAGSRDERKGRTGFAHLFEHMMFKGSEKVGQGEHFFLVFTNGGGMNGSTSTDRTNYYETLPKNQLDLALFLESDRMRSLAITKENLENQRNTVQEERRLGVDNQPYGKTNEAIGEMMYDNFAYKHSVIGSMDDLSAATVEDVSRFFKTYYAPNNAVLVLVGDLNPSEAVAKVKKYFGDIPRQEPPPPVDMTEPAQTAERRTTIEDKLARLPRVDMAWKGSFGNTPDAYALIVLGQILAGGESSRLHDTLVRQKEVAAFAGGGFGMRRGPGAFRVVGAVRPGTSLDTVEDLIEQEIARIQNEPPTPKEMLRALNSWRQQNIQTRESALRRAVVMGEYAVFYNDPNLINTMGDKIAAVTAADVQRVAKQFLNKQQRTLIRTVPAGRAPAPPKVD
jgi:predicted Zn-dependent peptidase